MKSDHDVSHYNLAVLACVATSSGPAMVMRFLSMTHGTQ